MRRLPGVEHALLFAIGIDERNLFVLAPRHAQIPQSLRIDGEDAASGSVFRSHIGNGRAICQRQLRESLAEELDEFANNPSLAQHFSHGEDKISGGRSFLQFACELG